MVQEVHRLFLARDRDEWVKLLVEAGTCVAPVNTMEEAFEDPQIRHLGMVWELEHPTQGKVRQMAFPVLFSETPAEARSFAPVLGQHTRELLAEAGFTRGDILELELAGVVKSA
jgi:crotonobetainyl-CoA:carnitine CoA-transferase CaiB-like acyl-CoA transferase